MTLRAQRLDLLCAPIPSYHPVGTCRMGSDAGAVVDQAGNFRGIEHLWVADASVMPQVVSGQYHAPRS